MGEDINGVTIGRIARALHEGRHAAALTAAICETLEVADRLLTVAAEVHDFHLDQAADDLFAAFEMLEEMMEMVSDDE